MKFINKFRKGLSKTSSSFTEIFTKKKLDQDALDELEEALIMADIGPKTAAKIIEGFKSSKFGKEATETEIKETLADEIGKILTPYERKLDLEGLSSRPRVILFVGVNGTGKTTTIGKLSLKATQAGKHTMIAACDTFRAAAVDQLKIWAERANAGLIQGNINSDPAALAYKAYGEAEAKDADILFIDTAGRLQNKKGLMDELEKIVRVLKKYKETIPHQTILVLDATTGQNAITQAEIFKQIANVTGIIITKLDGTAKGGVVVALADQLKMPIYAVGMGEGIEDLNDFSARDFARALVDLD